MAVVTIKDLLESGVHFGHQTKRWNPKMKRFIFEERNGIYIINLQKTMIQLQKACKFVSNVVAQGGDVLFVGTKKQAKDVLIETSQMCKMHYVTERWLGGTLTNNNTIRRSVNRLRELEDMVEQGTMDLLGKKEVSMLMREKNRLHKNLDGIKNMNRLPKAMFVVDPKREKIAVAEAKKLKIPVLAILDTNCDPDQVEFPIPGNDDAIKSVSLIASILATVVNQALQEYNIKREKEAEQEKAAAPKKAAPKATAKKPRAKKAAAPSEAEEAPKKVVVVRKTDSPAEETVPAEPAATSEPENKAIENTEDKKEETSE